MLLCWKKLWQNKIKLLFKNHCFAVIASGIYLSHFHLLTILCPSHQVWIYYFEKCKCVLQHANSFEFFISMTFLIQIAYCVLQNIRDLATKNTSSENLVKIYIAVMFKLLYVVTLSVVNLIREASKNYEGRDI